MDIGMSDATTATLDGRLAHDLKAAMRGGDSARRDVIRYLRAGLKNSQIERGRPLTPLEELAVLRQQIKQREDSIEQFQQGNRPDLVAREAAQLDILREYMPAPMGESELRELVRAVCDEAGATSPRDLGRVMPVLVTRAGGRVDNRDLSAAARAHLEAL